MDRLPLRAPESGPSLLTTLHSAYPARRCSAGVLLGSRSIFPHYSLPLPVTSPASQFLARWKNVLGSFSCPTIQDFFFPEKNR